MESDKAYQYWLTMTVDNEGQTARNGLGQAVAQYLLLGYADDMAMTARNWQWLQNALDLFVDS